MDKDTIILLCKHYDINPKVINYVNSREILIKDKFNEINKIKEYNQFKIIHSMQKARLSSIDFNWTTGYGYGDIGRDKVEEIYSHVFNTEDALVRPTIVSGTHAITLTLSGLLRPDDEFLSITGSPYDTLQKVIGVKGDTQGTLFDYGIKYKEIPLKDGKIDVDNAIRNISESTKLILIQRSTGYSDRKAINIDEIKTAINKIKNYNKDIIIMVDNCYGEFVEKLEPSDVGADVMAGSLIKNPGGGIALTGGYIVGKSNLIEQIANRSTAPGLGKDCGLTFGTTRTTLQGLFLAPHIVAEAIKGALLVGIAYKQLGFEIIPDLEDARSDIIQAIKFNSPDRVIEFCKGIQEASVVDSFVTPIPWNMPGYEDEVIMAAGGFIDGSSIELSADGPMREPYFAYYQGGLTYEHCKLGVMISINNLLKNNLIDNKKLVY
ncbi:cystathionine beta-lyase family protein involved in aluminum resistance [Keratinibaculum paraultunense]|uniref:Cystathionine beta-lyase family protein involved in aluminum resistance n=1 Tax=Keratinibaculum paraultunense TaxID=1278232 RepID=A0A4R3L0B0_9FIRM|nr:aminotransferase class I/II-fold pyridoxal phosphate-dependent enzyme [Keratinibaculum paraultunense]QQY80667.1 methionine gamma-lyase family protein [Keratinibaculum paraultunense]TCS91402.1 cystathionine beta-lyase family protein involved in aluminum resistance [Keratinibaculum paraultunense]